MLVRRLGFVVAGALGTAILGSLLLIAAGGANSGMTLEAVGVAAAVAFLAVIAFLAARSTGSTEPGPR